MYRFGFTFSNEVIIKKRIDWMIKVVLQENSVIKGQIKENLKQTTGKPE
tara:strand:- start:425 stop:571 length:147 start_codon:yes stop_codon:yes gene_type:complete